jgi:hypothetical protein
MISCVFAGKEKNFICNDSFACESCESFLNQPFNISVSELLAGDSNSLSPLGIAALISKREST